MQEYPKALYLSGQALIVDDEAQEEAARADGYSDWHADHERTEGGDTGANTKHPLDRDALKARAAELSLEYPANIKTDKLAALVAEAEGK